MQIGSVKISGKVILAPLAGITNLPFRIISKKCGCDLVYSEMVSSNGLVYKSEKTESYLKNTSFEKPLAVQIFGSDPEIMGKAAKIVESSGADIIDINCGCSVKKILKSQSGSFLMKTPDNAQKVIESVRKSVSIPLTIKIRTGWDRSGEQALNLAKIAENAGVDAIAVHPRTAQQGFKGVSDWSIIKAVKELVKIPVIGNGDIKEATDAKKMLDDTGCDAIMVGRAIMGNPLLFTQIKSLLEKDELLEITPSMIINIMREFVEESVIHLGEEKTCFMMRGRLGKFIKGFKGSSHFRQNLTQLSSIKEIMDLIDQLELRVN